MPDPKDNTQRRGDVHPPEVESDLPQEGMSEDVGADGTPRDRGQASERGQEQKPSRGKKRGGVLQDRDEPEPKDESRLG